MPALSSGPEPAPRTVAWCPACGAPLEVRRLQCPACATAVEGRFPASPFAALAADQLGFLEVFLRARGNLREVERVLGLSYPTVRARLDALLEALGLHGDGGDAAEEVARDAGGRPAGRASAGEGGDGAPIPSDARRRVLRALERGEISAAEAAALLRGG